MALTPNEIRDRNRLAVAKYKASGKAAIASARHAESILSGNSDKVLSCRKCKVTLTIGENLRPSRIKYHSYICNSCDPHRRFNESLPVGSRCRKCEIDLELGVNIVKGRAKSGNRLCNRCFNATPKERARRKEYRERNRARFAMYARNREARKRNQMPNDADLTKIATIYQMAQRATRVVGATYHVDHINALANGGMHHQDNLVVMRADLNQLKGATDWPWLKWFNEPVDAEPADRPPEGSE